MRQYREDADFKYAFFELDVHGFSLIQEVPGSGAGDITAEPGVRIIRRG
jgi:hypothetical protein